MRLPRPRNVLRKTAMRTYQFMKEASLWFFIGALAVGLAQTSGVLGILERLLIPVTTRWLQLPPEAATAFIMGVVRRDFGAAGLYHMTLSPMQITVALVTIAPACALAAVVAGTPESAGAAFVAAAVGGAAYVGVFIAIASLTRRTAVWSLAFVFLVERLLGTALTGIAQLSPTWESRAIFLGYLNHVPSDIVRTGIPQGGAAIVRLSIVTIVVLAVAVWRIGHMRWAGASD
jgi:Fe2+ transport system protein B